MKTLVAPIKTKIMPMVAASLLTVGTLTSCSTSTFNKDNSAHYKETITNMNDNLNNLNFAQTNGVIEFNDYFEKSKEVIKETKLEEESLKRENKAIVKDKNSKACGLIATGLIGMILTAILGVKIVGRDSFKDGKKTLLFGLIPIAMGLGALGIGNVNKENKEHKYIKEAQQSLQVYKTEKLTTLESYKNENLKQN